MHIEIRHSLSHVDRAQWNALTARLANPFVSHEFLCGLEACGCVGHPTGWSANHVLGYSDRSRSHLVGAIPMYTKFHSYGEYVFDWAWADAYQRAGLEYYPKLVVAVPFTPVAGPRILFSDTRVRDALVDYTLDYAEREAVSSLHWLFIEGDDLQTLNTRGLLHRTGTQFHWQNRGYTSFTDYLGAFTAHKRKKIKRERRRVHESGIRFEMLSGDHLQPRHIEIMYAFYRSTVAVHGAIPYLTREFFLTFADVMREHVVLILARLDSNYVAGALYLRGADALYGRYWGASADFRGLHFETCYYRPIEYCIEHGLQRFEAGAQGEHKLSRGLLPTPTHSMHWLREPRFASAVAHFLRHEKDGVAHYRETLSAHSPFKDAKTDPLREAR